MSIFGIGKSNVCVQKLECFSAIVIKDSYNLGIFSCMFNLSDQHRSFRAEWSFFGSIGMVSLHSFPSHQQLWSLRCSFEQPEEQPKDFLSL